MRVTKVFMGLKEHKIVLAQEEAIPLLSQNSHLHHCPDTALTSAHGMHLLGITWIYLDATDGTWMTNSSNRFRHAR